MESHNSLELRDLDALRRRALALREREDREGVEYQSSKREAGPAARADQPPPSLEVITGYARRTVSADN